MSQQQWNAVNKITSVNVIVKHAINNIYIRYNIGLMQYNTIQYNTTLYYTILYYIILHHITPYHIILYYIIYYYILFILL